MVNFIRMYQELFSYPSNEAYFSKISDLVGDVAFDLSYTQGGQKRLEQEAIKSVKAALTIQNAYKKYKSSITKKSKERVTLEHKINKEEEKIKTKSINCFWIGSMLQDKYALGLIRFKQKNPRCIDKEEKERMLKFAEVNSIQLNDIDMFEWWFDPENENSIKQAKTKLDNGELKLFQYIAKIVLRVDLLRWDDKILKDGI